MHFNVSQYPVQKFWFFCFHRFGVDVKAGTAQMCQDGQGVRADNCLPAIRTVFGFHDAFMKQIADIFSLGTGTAEHTGPGKLLRIHIGEHGNNTVHKGFTDPENIPVIRLQYRLRQQGAVADTGWNKDDIPFLEFIALCVYQVFSIAIIPTAQKFVKSVAVKVNIGS